MLGALGCVFTGSLSEKKCKIQNIPVSFGSNDGNKLEKWYLSAKQGYRIYICTVSKEFIINMPRQHCFLSCLGMIYLQYNQNKDVLVAKDIC